MAKALCIRLGCIRLCKTFAMMEDSKVRKREFKVEHVEISACSDGTSASCSKMSSLTSAGRPRRAFEGGCDLEGDGEGSLSLGKSREHEKEFALLQILSGRVDMILVLYEMKSDEGFGENIKNGRLEIRRIQERRGPRKVVIAEAEKSPRKRPRTVVMAEAETLRAEAATQSGYGGGLPWRARVAMQVPRYATELSLGCKSLQLSIKTTVVNHHSARVPGEKRQLPFDKVGKSILPDIGECGSHEVQEDTQAKTASAFEISKRLMFGHDPFEM